ncbi:MAG: hypothetical protein EOM51_01740 [Clostridia bacterium]|nr:hypothetical protein [Clostridia bacterium]
MSGIFDGLWRYGQKLVAFDGGATEGREFRGFLEPMNLHLEAEEKRCKAGVLPTEKYLLLAEPTEVFACGRTTIVVCGGISFELLSVREVLDGEKVTHRECVLLKVGEVKSDA